MAKLLNTVIAVVFGLCVGIMAVPVIYMALLTWVPDYVACGLTVAGISAAFIAILLQECDTYNRR